MSLLGLEESFIWKLVPFVLGKEFESLGRSIVVKSAWSGISRGSGGKEREEFANSEVGFSSNVAWSVDVASERKNGLEGFLERGLSGT